jgi:hypothetical protein
MMTTASVEFDSTLLLLMNGFPLRFAVSHPYLKNKDAARMGHPANHIAVLKGRGFSRAASWANGIFGFSP